MMKLRGLSRFPFPFDGWVVRVLPTGRVVHERLRGTPGYRSQARAQVFLALDAAAYYRRMGFRMKVRAALADAGQWRAREARAVLRGAPSDHLWSAHAAVHRSDPATWQAPWTVEARSLGHGMVLRDALERR